VGGQALLRTVVVICAVIAVGGLVQYRLETRLMARLDETWTGNPHIVARETYRYADGSVIIAKGGRFLAEANRLGVNRSHVELLRDASHHTVRIISHEVFADLPDALRWAAVCVITVGYGDRRPTTASGRLLAVQLMTMSVFLLWSFVSTLAATFRDIVRRVWRASRTDSILNGIETRGTQSAWWKRINAAKVAAVVFFFMGDQFAPINVVGWVRLRPSGVPGVLVLGLAVLSWIVLLTVAVGVWHESHACIAVAYTWWVLGAAFALYSQPEMMARLHLRPPGVFQHASWAAGVVVIGRVFMPVFVEYTRRIAGSFATRSQPPA
jgi:hypothetical protein